MITPVIEFRGVSKIYGNPADSNVQVKALNNVSFSVNKGEFVAIEGPSGSGKSTMLNLIGLLDKQSEGEILVDGVETDNLNGNQLAKFRNEKIGFVFQQFNLLPKTPAMVNVELPLIYRGIGKGEREKMAKDELNKVGLGERLMNKPSQLSGGQQQRVAIARALVTKPSLLLADEPTGNLDSKTGAAILELFKELHRSGITIIMVTHDPEIAAEAGRQIIVRDGQIVNIK